MEDLKKYYICIKDLQEGTFGVGRLHTVEEWRETAIGWADMDDRDELIKVLEELTEDELMEEIQETWQIEIEQVSYLTLGIMEELEYINNDVLDDDSKKQLDTLDLYEMACHYLDYDTSDVNWGLQSLICEYQGEVG